MFLTHASVRARVRTPDSGWVRPTVYLMPGPSFIRLLFVQATPSPFPLWESTEARAHVARSRDGSDPSVHTEGVKGVSCAEEDREGRGGLAGNRQRTQCRRLTRPSAGWPAGC